MTASQVAKAGTLSGTHKGYTHPEAPALFMSKMKHAGLEHTSRAASKWDDALPIQLICTVATPEKAEQCTNWTAASQHWPSCVHCFRTPVTRLVVADRMHTRHRSCTKVAVGHLLKCIKRLLKHHGFIQYHQPISMPSSSRDGNGTGLNTTIQPKFQCKCNAEPSGKRFTSCIAHIMC